MGRKRVLDNCSVGIGCDGFVTLRTGCQAAGHKIFECHSAVTNAF